MKALFKILVLAELVVSSCTTSNKISGEYDDLYYSPSDKPVARVQSNLPIQGTDENQKVPSTSDFNRIDHISKQPADAKKTNVAISYAPLLGFWLGPWPLSVNLSITHGFFESSTTLAIVRESDSRPNAMALYTLVGPRYVFPSQSNTHFFVHGLLGAGFHKESRKEDGFFSAVNESHLGVYFSPGLGVYFKKPSKSGFRLGFDFIAAPGFPSDIWVTSFTGAFQLSVGIIF